MLTRLTDAVPATSVSFLAPTGPSARSRALTSALAALPRLERCHLRSSSLAPPACCAAAGGYLVCGVGAITTHTRTSIDIYRLDFLTPVP